MVGDRISIALLSRDGREVCPGADLRVVDRHPALGAKGHRLDPSKRSKCFQRLISRLTTSWVNDHVISRCRLNLIVKKHSGSDHPQGISALSFPTVSGGEGVSQPLQHRGCAEKRQPGDFNRNKYISLSRR